jgi:putative chitinase
MFTAERLRQLAEAPAVLAMALAPHLDKSAGEFGVTNLMRRAHFIAQACHESGRFARLTENMNYSAMRIPAIWPRLAPRAEELAHRPEALANAAYANREGNGPEESGDGWRYRGRGLIQLTFRNNYRARGLALGLDLEAEPNLAAEPEIAVKSALSFWRDEGCNEIADLDDVGAVTKKINGPAALGLKERRELTERAKTIFV